MWHTHNDLQFFDSTAKAQAEAMDFTHLREMTLYFSAFKRSTLYFKYQNTRAAKKGKAALYPQNYKLFQQIKTSVHKIANKNVIVLLHAFLPAMLQ